MDNDNIKVILFCEIIINHLIVAYGARHHPFKPPRITAFCRNHEYWC